MGILCDVVVADVRDAKKVLDYDTWGEFDSVDTPDLMPELLGSLLRTLDGKSKKFNQKKEAPEIYRASEAGGWLYKFPNELVELLAQLDKKSIKKVTRAWIESDEFFERVGEESYPFIEKLVDSLRLISKRAVREKKPLLLRIIL